MVSLSGTYRWLKICFLMSSNTWSFQEVLADLRTTRIGMGLPSPAEILHGRNLTTRAQAEIDIKAIRSVAGETAEDDAGS